jgi:hypothetical protein
MSAIKFRAKSDGLQLLRAIDATQAHGQEGVRADPTGPPTTPGWTLATSARIVTTAPWATFARRARWWGTSTRRPGRAPGNTTAYARERYPRMCERHTASLSNSVPTPASQ